jgi:hypothetical protein
MALFLRRFPFDDVLVLLKGENAGKATDELVKWGESVGRQADASPTRPQAYQPITGIGASASGTLGGEDVSGVYRVTVYREVTTADPVSSALNGSINWTHNSKAMTRALSAFGGGLQSILDSAGDTLEIQIDPGTAISWTLVYASNTPGLARFTATLIAELLQTVG